MQKKALPVRALDHQQQWLCPCPREQDTWAGRTRSRCSLWLGEVRRKGSLRLPRGLDRGTSEQFIRKSLTLTFSPDKRLSFQHLLVPQQGTSTLSCLFAWKMPPTTIGNVWFEFLCQAYFVNQHTTLSLWKMLNKLSLVLQ